MASEKPRGARRDGGSQIRDLLHAAGLTQQQVAKALRLDTDRVRDWCDGRAEAPRDIILALQRLAAVQRRLP